MQSTTEIPLILLDSFMLTGYIAHVLGSQIHVPRVILLLLVRIVAGPADLNIIPEAASQ